MKESILKLVVFSSLRARYVNEISSGVVKKFTAWQRATKEIISLR